MRKQELHPRTAVINKKQKSRSKLARHDALNWLAKTFPKAFDNRESIQPLKLGIMADILKYAETAGTTISNSKLREAVVVYTRRVDYLACLKAGGMRIDLEGNPVMPVTEEEANHAAQKIKKRVEKSAKNARKLIVSKPTGTGANASKNTYPKERFSEPEVAYFYPERAPAFSAQNTAAQPSRTASVIVKKSTKTYDPNAVARLKEKLGLSRKNSLNEE